MLSARSTTTGWRASPDIVDLLLRFLHVGIAAAWFGHKLLVPSDLKASVSGTAQQARDMIPRISRAERVGQVSGVGTLLTGTLLTLVVGFETVGIGVHIGMGLVVTAIAIGAIFARPASNRLKAAVEVGDLDAARPEARRLNQVLGIESLLWAATLMAMLA